MPNLRNLLCGEAAGLAIIEVQWTTTQKKLSKNAKYFLAFFSNFCSFLVKLYITNFKTEFKVFSGILKKISLQCTTKKSETGISNYHPVPSSLYTFNQKKYLYYNWFWKKNSAPLGKNVSCRPYHAEAQKFSTLFTALSSFPFFLLLPFFLIPYFGIDVFDSKIIPHFFLTPKIFLGLKFLSINYESIGNTRTFFRWRCNESLISTDASQQ